MFSSFFFLIVAHSILGETQRTSVGWGEKVQQWFSVRAEQYKKLFEFNTYCTHKLTNSISWVLLVCSYTTAIASLHFSDCSPKSEMHAVPKLSVWYEPRPFQNTVYSETKTWIHVYGWFKDAQFPKLPAWAYNITYSNSHRTRLFFSKLLLKILFNFFKKIIKTK